MVTKDALRVATMKRRIQLSPAERKLASLKICQDVFSIVDWTKVKRVNAYKALQSLHEVDPRSLLAMITKNYPRIEIVVSPFQANAQHPKGEFEVVIVPMVAFDSNCNRIGMGGGWYDGYFAAHANAIKIGVAYSTQEVPVVPISPLDVPMDIVVTEKAIFRR